ncbi:hypothetical protein BC833DRAFT_647915 [Globomyces pollinis-pini]|nr:hypothetical protein BC833DRAFT_647915 [Globomyces pollinis-pini]
MSMLTQVLEKIGADCSNKDVKDAIDDALKTAGDAQLADGYWNVLKSALLDAQSTVSALNGINKLIAHVLLVGKAPGSPEALQEFKEVLKELQYCQESIDIQPENFRLLDEIILCISQVAFFKDDVNIRLQVLKLFLTIVTGEGLYVHSFGLMLILKICFHIHSTANPKSTNELTSKASLTQMINLIFSRMERYATVHSSVLEAHSDNQMTLKEGDSLPHKELEASEVSFNEIPNTVSTENDPVSSESETQIELNIESSDDSNGTEVPTTAVNGIASADEAAIIEHFTLLKRDVRMTLLFLSQYAMSAGKTGQTEPATFNPRSVSELTTLDELPPASIKDRALSLELILSVFNNLGVAFREEEDFFKIIQENICLVISRNAVTTNPNLFELSLSIFLLIIRYYRHRLKLEVEVLLGIYLQILEMGNSTYKQKSNILQGLLKICENPQTLMDIYLNYDCEFEMVSIYEKMISICSRITQGRGESSNFAAKSGGALSALGFGDPKLELIKQQDRRLHLRSLCILSAIIESLVKWCGELIPPSVVSAPLSGKLGSAQDEDPLANKSSFADNPVVVVKNPLNAISMDHRASSSATNVEDSEDINEQVEQVASRKQLYRHSISIFNKKPKKGIKSFIEGGFVEETPPAVAQFLLSTSELSKSAIGEYIGENEPFNLKVMHTFIDSMNFAGFDFVAALRHFLQSFRLPGEAQKIDRLMEKFADRYCESNPTVFSKADTAYTLAFSVIMLNTDQHSAQIKHRMDAAAFIKNNRGINDDGDLPEEFLKAIFEEIHTNEIIMEDEQSDKLTKIAMGWGAGELNENQRLEIYKKEASMIQKKTQLLMSQGVSSRVIPPFRSATSKELARPMFATYSWAIMAALSLSFEGSVEDTEVEPKKPSKEPIVSDLCLSAFVGAIRLAAIFKLETERDAYVTSLSQMTFLSHFYDIKPKNTKAINTMIELASTMGENLDTAWVEVMKALSQLERMQVTVLRGEELTAKNTPASKRNSTSVDESRAGAYQELAKETHTLPPISKVLEKYVEEVQSQSSIIVIDRIFTKSVQLSGNAIIYFFKAVCEVSLEEVCLSAKGDLIKTTSQSAPRMYLLQKIVEIAYYNLSRIRFEWTQIWRILQPHFNRVACHPDLRVANFAVDSLRQLGVKILDREELGHFSTQHEFLKSFEWIIKHNQTNTIRELILSSLSQMITARASRIRSGWKSIFVTLGKAAQTSEKMAQLTFQTIRMIFQKHFEDVIAASAFVDLVSCLAECALLRGTGPAHDELVMSSIQMLQSCTKSLMERAEDEANGKKTTSVVVPVAVNTGQPQASAVTLAQPHAHVPRINNLPTQAYLLPNGCVSEEHFYLSWFPILTAFSRVVTESEGVLVRTHTMEILFETLKTGGHLFDAPYWKTINRNIISPIFEDLSDPEETSLRESNSAVLIHGLRLLGQLVFTHFSLLTNLAKGGDNSSLEFLQISINRMIEMMQRNDDKLASTGQTCFSQFLISCVGKFDDESWSWVTDHIVRAFEYTLPSELIKCQGPNPTEPQVPRNIIDAANEATKHIEAFSLDSLDFEKTVIKCVTHLELLSTVKDFCLQKTSSNHTIITIIPHDDRARILKSLYSSYAIARLFNAMISLRHAIHKRGWVSQLPNLVKQETTSLSTYIALLFPICEKYDDDIYIQSLGSEILDLFTRFSKILTEQAKNQRDIASWSPIIVTVLKDMIEMDSLWVKGSKSQKYLELSKIYRFACKLFNVDRSDLRSVVIQFFEKIGNLFFDGE